MALTGQVLIDTARFMNDFVRPLAHQIRDQMAKLKDAQLQFDRDLKASIPISADIIPDGRAESGIGQLSQTDVRQFMSSVDDLITAYDTAAVRLNRPVFKPIDVNSPRG